LRSKVELAMQEDLSKLTTRELGERIRITGERADLHAKSAAFHLRRLAAALRAQGYGSAPRRGR
jgi:hypothetical protein